MITKIVNFFRKSKIDRLVDRNTKLSIKKQNLQQNKNIKDTNLGNKITKLQNKRTILNQIAKNQIIAIDNEISKNEQLIKVEIDYNNTLDIKK